MAKARKSNRNLAKTGQAGAQPLQGIQKVALWSVPAVFAIFLACAGTLAYLYFSKPATVAKVPSDRTPNENVESSLAEQDPLLNDDQPKNYPTENLTTTTEGLVDAESAKEPSSEPAAAESGSQSDPQTSASPADVVAAEPEPKEAGDATGPENSLSDPSTTSSATPPAPSTPIEVTLNAKTIVSLVCDDGKISFSGPTELKFVDSQPTLQVTEESGVKFAHLLFDGMDQSAELPPVSRSQGSLEMVAKLPSQNTSIFLDSNYQRLTLRKNRDGLRWRVAGVQKPDKIRDVSKPVDFDQWHHIVVTWKSGGAAILYVDGIEYDRFNYIHEQPHFAEYEDVVLGRTRGPNSRFYECRIHRYKVFDQPIPAADVAKLNQAIRQTYPFIFR
ncbi:LamG-like jellyroll fold domain-containing protein [Mariniblastus fucicola]|uniref:LamG-like jellyroll fold domain-containing protein n=1 Tax=Mariniblastus fucicola TaxID=980251 RepID=A0A5B9PGW3_9BACT|nr:LamG-like jellyroll fold domain-containing protein [Mariniblastus fucicola]QEG22151.1 hypothetical protein MFFC18_20120 [Mariniblastus fucicola]